MSDLNLDEIKPWLAQCGRCDAGLPMACTCSEGDPRVVMARLVAEVEQLRRTRDRLEVRLHQHRHIADERTKEANDQRAALAANEDSEDARLAIAEQRVSLAQGLAEDWAASTDVLLASAGRGLLNTLGGAR